MIPTDNKSPKVSELIEVLQKCDQYHRVRIVVDDLQGFGIIGGGPVSVSRHTIPCQNGFTTCVEIHQDELAE